jgi:4-amino-4-deoxy-L-arabinose transferase-like glycosyltransferase
LLPIVSGLITGAFIARLGLELTGRPWPRSLVVALAVLAAGAGGLVGWRISYLVSTRSERYADRVGDRSGRSGWPLLLLALYLFWPQRQLTAAVQLVLVVGLAMLLDSREYNITGHQVVHRPERTRRDGESFSGKVVESAQVRAVPWERLANLLVFIFALFIYGVTTAPDVLPADSGEFQIVAPLLGVAHPPGYPLYTLSGWLFTRVIPFGTLAYRLNLMSAFLAAGTLTLLGAAARRWARRLGATAEAAVIGGVAAALTLGTATTFWAQATVANIRMPTVFWAALGFYALARYAGAAGRAQADRALALLALALGLGIGHHPSLVFLGVFFLLYLVWIDPRLLIKPRRWWKPLLVALIALLPLIYLPLRGAADARLAPPDLDTLDGFVHHVTAQGFEGDMFAFANAEDLPLRLSLLPTLFGFQFNPVLLASAALGLLLLAWRDRGLLVLLAGGLTLHTFVSITYRAPQTIEYLMPAYLPLAILVGLATAGLCNVMSYLLPRRGAVQTNLSSVTALLAAIILLAGFTNGLDHGPSFFTLSDDRSTRTAMESLLHQAPEGARILADWHWATPLWYLQWVEGQRPDVEVRYVYPVPGQEYSDTWKDRIEAVYGERPLVLTHAFDWPAYTLEPVGPGFWIHLRPYHAALDRFSSLDASFSRGEGEGSVRLLGYRLSLPHARAGQTFELTLAWETVGALAAPPSFLVRLTGDDGQQLAQADRYLRGDYASGEMRFVRLVLPVYPNVPPGAYQLAVQVYSPAGEGFETWSLQTGAPSPEGDGQTLSLTVLPVHPNSTPPFSLHPLDIPFGDGPTLVGVDYDRSVPGMLRLYLRWRGPASGDEQIRVRENTAQLPELSEGAFQTVVLDLTGETQGQPRLMMSGADGETRLAAGPWGWPLREVPLPLPSASVRFVPLDDEMALIGVSPGGDARLALGGELPLRLTFVALKPLVSDNGISVRLWDEADQLRRMHDLQPALGAIPTLKWIRGSCVTDPHPLLVPSDLPGQVVRASLVVYDNFRGTPLLPMDGRIESVPLGEWMISGR